MRPRCSLSSIGAHLSKNLKYQSEDHTGVAGGVLGDDTGISVDGILRNVVNNAVVGGGNFDALGVGTGIVAGEEATVAEHIVAALGLEGEFKGALFLYALGSVCGVERVVGTVDDRAGTDGVEVGKSVAILAELGISLSAVQIDLAEREIMGEKRWLSSVSRLCLLM